MKYILREKFADVQFTYEGRSYTVYYYDVLGWRRNAKDDLVVVGRREMLMLFVRESGPDAKVHTFIDRNADGTVDETSLSGAHVERRRFVFKRRGCTEKDLCGPLVHEFRAYWQKGYDALIATLLKFYKVGNTSRRQPKGRRRAFF